MATKGSFNTSAYKFSGGDRYLTFNWEATAQSVTDNTTTIKWELVGAGSYPYSPLVSDIHVEIDGEVVYDQPSSYHVQVYPGDIVASGTKVISHNDDGRKTFTAFAEAGIYLHAANCDGSGTFTLETIPRKSGLTVSNGVLGVEQTITVDKKAADFTHTITYVCGKESGTICDKSGAVNISWTPPLDLAEQNTTGITVNVELTITTYNVDIAIGSQSKKITCSIPESVKPSCALSISDPMGYAQKYGGYVKGLSKLEIVIVATPSYGSPISSYNTVVNGTRYPNASFVTDVLQIAGEQNIVATVTDKRKRSGSATATINVIDYTPPMITALSVHRCNADGVENDQGEYIEVVFSGRVSELGDGNTARYSVEYKKSADPEYSSETLTEYNDVFSVTDATFIFAADSGSSYDIRVIAADSLTNDTETTSASTGFTLMHLKADGTAIGIGKVAETSRALDMGMDIELNDNNILRNGETAFTSAGYGLGETIRVSKDINSEIETGYFAVSAETANVNVECGAVHVRKYNDSYIVQNVFDFTSGCEIVRYSTDGGISWVEEYENPPMEIGVEYRTTKRYNSKVVYAKAVDLGALPNATYNDIPMGISITELVSLDVLANYASGNWNYHLPLLGVDGSVRCFACTVGSNIRVYSTNYDASTYTGKAIVEYIKG